MLLLLHRQATQRTGPGRNSVVLRAAPERSPPVTEAGHVARGQRGACVCPDARNPPSAHRRARHDQGDDDQQSAAGRLRLEPAVHRPRGDDPLVPGSCRTARHVGAAGAHQSFALVPAWQERDGAVRGDDSGRAAGGVRCRTRPCWSGQQRAAGAWCDSPRRPCPRRRSNGSCSGSRSDSGPHRRATQRNDRP